MPMPHSRFSFGRCGALRILSGGVAGASMLALAACQTTSLPPPPPQNKAGGPAAANQAVSKADAAAFEVIVGSWRGTWGSWRGQPRLTTTLTVEGESPGTMRVQYCSDKCWPTPGAAFRDGALSWNDRGWRFKFTPQDDGTLKGTLTTHNGVNAVVKTRI